MSNRVWKVACSAGVTVGLVALGIVVGVAPAQASPSLTTYVSAPFVQGPGMTGLELETFDTECPATWWFGESITGSMSGDCRSVDGNYWAGASDSSGLPTLGGTQTKFGQVFEGDEITVTLSGDASYLGFYWEAGDGSNVITFYNDDQVVATFTTQDLLAMLNNDEMGLWSAQDYIFHPARNETNWQPYAYVHLVGSGGLTFDKFVISQPWFWGFEFDNFALAQNPPTFEEISVVTVGDETPPDANQNGIDDTTEDLDGDGVIDPFEDANGDGRSDVLEDSDGDGINDYAEASTLPDTGASDLWPSAAGAALIMAVGLTLLIVYRRRTRTTNS